MQGAVNYNDLNDCSNELKKIAEDMKNITSEFINTVNSVSNNSYWMGPAAGNYFTKSKELNPIFDEAYTQVLGYAKFLDNTIKRYQDIDKQVSSLMGF